MPKLFGRWFGQRDAPAVDTPPAHEIAAPPLTLRADATLPIVDWEAMDAHAPDTEDAVDAYWTSVAQAWLETLGVRLGSTFRVRASDRFLLLSPFDERRARSILDYVEKTRKRILRLLDGVAVESETGKVCLLVFEDQEQYYEYVANYHSEEGEHALSSGMFIQHGYGHFVFVQDHLSTIEPVIAHELTHCLVQHLPLPAWLNEGIAVNTERRLSPPLGAPLYTAAEMHRKHVAYWNEETIQEFWSGKSWRRQDDGNMLSYDLAVHFVQMCSRDFDAFRGFANGADYRDSGDAAARANLGFSVAHLAEAVLGDGPWAPHPARWNEGIERGQFVDRDDAEIDGETSS
jgi:hypothetical protein